MRHQKVGKRGAAMPLYFLLELILAFGVIAVLWFAVTGMVDNTIFFQKFFAKDNAHIIETLHAVPNGQLQFAYLLNNPNFKVELGEQAVSVYGVKKLKDGTEIPKSGFSKAFGRSKGTELVPVKNFTPNFYYFNEYQAEQRTVALVRDFASLNCPASPTPLQGIAITSQSEGLDREYVEAKGKWLLQYVSTARTQEFGNRGPSVHIVAVRSSFSQTDVYYTTLGEQSRRLACVITKGISEQGTNARLAHSSQAPEDLQQRSEDILVLIRAPDEQSFDRAMERVAKGILQYWEAS